MNWLRSITVKPGNFISKPSCHSRPSGQDLNSHPLLSLWVWTSLRTAGAASPTHQLSYEFKTNKSSPQISEGSWDTRPRSSEVGANLHACQETLADFQVCGRGSACHGFFPFATQPRISSEESLKGWSRLATPHLGFFFLHREHTSLLLQNYLQMFSYKHLVPI